MKRFLILLAISGITLASCSSGSNKKEKRTDSAANDTIGAQAPGDSVRLADSAVNRADHVKVDSTTK